MERHFNISFWFKYFGRSNELATYWGLLNVEEEDYTKLEYLASSPFFYFLFMS